MNRGFRNVFTRRKWDIPDSPSQTQQKGSPGSLKRITFEIPEGVERFSFQVDLTHEEGGVQATDHLDWDKMEFVDAGRPDTIEPDFQTRSYPSRRDKTIRATGRAVAVCGTVLMGLIVVVWSIYRFERGGDTSSIITMLGSYALIVIALATMIERYLKKK